MIIAIDFDGTIVDHEFPKIGKLKPNARKVINRLFDEGHDIVIWTCRTSQDFFEGKHEPTLLHVYRFLLREGIHFTTINHNSPRAAFQATPKVYADVYIDDRNLGGIPNDWEDIYLMLNENKS